MQATAAQVKYTAKPRVEIRPMLRNVYLWMTLGLIVTAITAYLTVQNKQFLMRVAYNPWIAWGLFFVQLILVAALIGAVQRLSTAAAGAIFLVYAASVGLTLSTLLIYYTQATITQAFLTAAFIFLVMSILGAFTKVDLTKMNTLLLVALVGLIFASFLNIFFRSSSLDLIISWIGVIIFTALIASDTQAIIQMASDPRIEGSGGALLGKLSIMGALTLYLNFLNLFLFLVRIFGRR